MWCPVFVALKFCCFHIKCCLSTEVCAHFLRIKAKLRKQKITLCMLQQWRRRTCLKCASSPELFRKKKMRFLFLHRRICLCLIFSSFSSFVSLQDKRTKENAYKSYFLLLSWEQWVKNIPLRKKNNIRFFFFWSRNSLPRPCTKTNLQADLIQLFLADGYRKHFGTGSVFSSAWN